MPTIADRLMDAGVLQAEKVWGRSLIHQRLGTVLTGEFEHIDPLILESELGPDPREGSWFHFRRPLPDLVIGDRLMDTDNNTVWEVLAGFEDHPEQPRAKVKVKKITAQDQ